MRDFLPALPRLRHALVALFCCLVVLGLGVLPAPAAAPLAPEFSLRHAALAPLSMPPGASRHGEHCFCTACSEALVATIDPRFVWASFAAKDGKPGPLNRAKMRVFLHLSRHKATAEQKAAIDKVLASPKTLDSVYEGLHGEYAAQAGGKLSDFFDWLLEHQDQILALIMKILPLIIGEDGTHAQTLPPEIFRSVTAVTVHAADGCAGGSCRVRESAILSTVVETACRLKPTGRVVHAAAKAATTIVSLRPHFRRLLPCRCCP